MFGVVDSLDIFTTEAQRVKKCSCNFDTSAIHGGRTESFSLLLTAFLRAFVPPWLHQAQGMGQSSPAKAFWLRALNKSDEPSIPRSNRSLNNFIRS